jgi:tetratricopeptide (TPR) repeat protein
MHPEFIPTAAETEGTMAKVFFTRWRLPIAIAGIVLLAVAVVYILSTILADRADRELKVAVAHMLKGDDLDAARRGLLHYLDEKPGSVVARYDLGLLAEAREDWPDALKWYGQVKVFVLARSPMALRTDIHIKRCQDAAAEDAQPGGKARRQYREMIARAQMFARAGLSREAIAEAAEAAKRNPQGWEVHVVTAEALAAQKRYQYAVGQLQVALSLAPPESRDAIERAIATNRREGAGQGAADVAIARANTMAKARNYLAAAHFYQVAWLHHHDAPYELAAAEAFIAGGAGREAKLLLQDILRRYPGAAADKAKALLAKFPAVRK